MGIGYRLISLHNLDRALSEIAVCKICHSALILKESFSHRKGLVSSLKIECVHCSETASISDPYIAEDAAINDASILGMRLAGLGHSALNELSACLGMLPPLTAPSWSLHNKKLAGVASEVAKECFLEASRQLNMKMGMPVTDIIDVTVTVDGTWQKRGRTSLFGIVVVMSWLTGQVLAIEVLSKHCQACKMKQVSDMEEDEYEEWYDGHKDVCDSNYEGSSNAMEMEGVERIWKRSVADLNLRFTTYIGDGDSKALVVLKPYGDGVKLTKHECVGHVQKRMGTALRKLKVLRMIMVCQ